MEGEERKRKKFPSDDRIPYLDRVLHEAGRPLTQKEIMAALGWTEESDGTSTRKILLRYPERYRRVRGTKRNEQWELTGAAPAEVHRKPLEQIVPPPPVLPEAARHAVADAERAAATAVVLERIRGMVQEFRTSPDPHRALFTLGEIAGILGEPMTETPPTEPAA